MDPFKPYQPKPKLGVPPKLLVADAEVIAIRALGFISGDDTLLSRFVTLTGCGIDEMRGRIHDPGFLGGVLDFLLGDEVAVIAFAEATALHPEAAMLARCKLP
jgi:Protein of unknown function (DUF3572)